VRWVLVFLAVISLEIAPAISIAASNSGSGRSGANHPVSKRARHTPRARTRHKSHARSRHTRRRYRRVRRRTYQLHPTAARYKQIQQALADKGFYRGDIDGEWGPRSVSALQRFQTARGIDSEGKITALALIGLGLGPKHTHSVVPVVAPGTTRPEDDSEISEEKQESSPLPEDEGGPR